MIIFERIPGSNETVVDVTAKCGDEFPINWDEWDYFYYMHDKGYLWPYEFSFVGMKDGNVIIKAICPEEEE